MIFRKIKSSFVGSKAKDWIGSVEVGLVLDQYCSVPCRILPFSSGQQLPPSSEAFRGAKLSHHDV